MSVGCSAFTTSYVLTLDESLMFQTVEAERKSFILSTLTHNALTVSVSAKNKIINQHIGNELSAGTLTRSETDHEFKSLVWATQHNANSTTVLLKLWFTYDRCTSTGDDNKSALQ